MQNKCHSFFSLYLADIKRVRLNWAGVNLRDKMFILSRIVWYYDSSGVQAKQYYGSLSAPILFCVKDNNNYTFNSDDILVEAKPGAIRTIIHSDN